MAYENTGRLFLNERKTTDKQPDYTGDFVAADGVKMQAAAWLKPGTDGRPRWLSFRINEKQSDPLAQTGEQTPAGDDDEIPF